MSGSFSTQEISQHTEYGNLWVIIKNHVYDLSKFADLHPAGRNVLKEYAGKDVTDLFKQFHADSVLHKYHEKLCIGVVSDQKPPEYSIIKSLPNTFGEGIPFGDPMNMQGFASPYYKNSHKKLRVAFRSFLEKEIAPFVDSWDDKKVLPRDIFRKIAQSGMLAAIIGVHPWPSDYYKEQEVAGVPIKKLDYFHEIIMIEEMMKYASVGIAWGVGTVSIGLPPIYNQGSQYLKDKYVSQILKGEKFVCLAITEPWAGSDVAGIKTTAELSEDGKYYIVNGMKKFITTAAFADVFTTAVRTGGEGYFGVSLLAIERSMPGVKTRKMNMQGVWGSGTAFIIFENVKVPVEQLIGEEGMGFMYIMQNFNHERFQIGIKTIGASRVVYEQCMKYAHLRKTFGKQLIEQPVIRQKLANMIKEIESLQAWFELIAFNMQTMTKKQEKVIAAAIAFAKAHGTLVFEKICQDAMQIVGGVGYQRGGPVANIERYYRETKSLTLGGGTPEIMFDMAVRQSNRLMPKPKM